MEQANRKSSKMLITISLVTLLYCGYCSLAGSALSLSAAIEADNTVIAKTSSGLLRGIKQQSTANNAAQNGAILKFLSVPYAEAPIGELRFKRPQELKSQQTTTTEQVINASQFGKTCPQYRHLTQFISPLLNIDNEHQTSEDCLKLNIFVPGNVGSINNDNVVGQTQNQKLLEPNKQLPVIVWIPGEGFDFADARQFDGSNLALRTQSIVVTVQYRVGVLGFLHAPKLNITGNMGVYDQIMALRWIQKNIDNFGGDSDRVTLMGRFSGSMSISAMITAPQHRQLLKGIDGRSLFQRVALLSGIAVDDWIIDSNQHEKVAQLEAAALAKEYCSQEQMRAGNCLSGMPIEQLMRISNYGWRLVRDNELIGQQSPIEAIKSGQISSELDAILLGETGMEGTLCMYRHALDSRTNYAQLIDEDKLTSQDLFNIIRDDSQTYFRYNTNNKTNPIEMALGALIESSSSSTSADNLMLAGGDQSMENQERQPKYLREKYLNACSAYMIKSHLNRFKRNLLANNQQLDNRMDSSKKPIEVYHYELRYKPTFSLAPDYIKTAAHGDDIPLIFGLVHNQPRAEIDEADSLMTRKMMSYIGNFIHGNQPLLAHTTSISSSTSGNSQQSVESKSPNETTSIDENENQDAAAAVGSLAINIKARSWANEGQLHHIEFDEADQQELNARKRHHHHQQQQYQRQSSSQSMGYSNTNNNNEDNDVKKSADKSINIRLVIVDSINQQQQPQQQQQQQQESNEIFFQRRRIQFLDRQQQQSAFSIQQLQPIPSQQTNMTLINESSFVTMLLFGICLVIFALMCTCLGFCLIIFRGSSSLNLAKTREQQQQQGSIKQQHYVNSSTSSCDLCEESQGGSIDAVLSGARGKDARAFSNVFAKLGNNQSTPQSHHHTQQQQQQHSQQQQQPQTQHQPSAQTD